MTYLLPDGTTLVKTYTVAPTSRFNIWVEPKRAVDRRGWRTRRCRRGAVTNGVPVLVERAMWWPGPTAATWAEGHNSPGMTASGSLWAMAEGEQGGTQRHETYLLVANPTATPATVQVTLAYDDGTPASSQLVTVPANSRVTLTPPVHFAAQFPAGTHRRFGAVVESVGATPVPIVVERAMSSTPPGALTWAAGTNAAATRLR